MILNNKEDEKSGWDARQQFAKEIVKRISIFNNISINVQGTHLSCKLEALTDLFDTTSAWFREEDIKKVNESINEAELLIYSKSHTTKEISERMRKADTLLRSIFRQTMKFIKLAGLLMPEKENVNAYEETEKSY